MMRWNYLLVEVYCFDPTCDRSYIDHLEHRQGAWCEGDLEGFLFDALGMRIILRYYLRALWEYIYDKLRWHLWRRWTYDDEAFMKYVEEHTLKEGECPMLDDFFDAEKWRCHFPDSSDSEAD